MLSYLTPQVELLMKDIGKHETHGLDTRAIKDYSKHLPEFIALKVLRVRNFSTPPCSELAKFRYTPL